jgi:hypothetical protein
MQRRELSPWLAFAALVVLFELPVVLLAEPWRPSGEPLALASVWLLGARLRLGAWLRAATVLVGAVLMLFRIDRVAILFFLGDEPLLYDQLFLLRHLLVLIADLWNVRVAMALVALLAAIALVAWGVRGLLVTLALPAERAQRRRLYAAGALLWAFVLIGSLVGSPRVVRWTTAGLIANARESVRIYDRVQRRLGASPYAVHDAVALTRKPDVHLVLVESYGRVIVEHPAMRPRWLAQIDRMQAALDAGGWHVASGFTRAPIMGGRSWLAEASLLTGMRVSYQAEFYHVMSQIERVPHLVRFLDRQGYHTVLLGPADRERRGIRNTNYYGYDRQLGFHDLKYRGPKIGWGLVPDQYSAAYTREHVLAQAPRPLFFNFHMVTSHAPWDDVPQIASDWRTLQDRPGASPEPASGSPYNVVKRFVRSTTNFANMHLSGELGARYTSAILYELDVIEQHLAALPADALVIVLGDHQPPLIASQMQSFDSPVHVFARDPLLLEELRQHGFRAGLRLDSHDRTAITHEGLYSLLVRSLARCCAQPMRELPPYRDGITLDSD